VDIDDMQLVSCYCLVWLSSWKKYNRCDICNAVITGEIFAKEKGIVDSIYRPRESLRRSLARGDIMGFESSEWRKG